MVYCTCQDRPNTGLDYKAVPRLQECCRLVETGVVSNSRNKIHQTWERLFSRALYIIPSYSCLHIKQVGISERLVVVYL